MKGLDKDNQTVLKELTPCMINSVRQAFWVLFYDNGMPYTKRSKNLNNAPVKRDQNTNVRKEGIL